MLENPRLTSTVTKALTHREVTRLLVFLYSLLLGLYFETAPSLFILMLSSTSGSHCHHWVGAVWLADQIFDWTSYWTGAPNNVAVSVFRFDLEIKCPFKTKKQVVDAGGKTGRLWGFSMLVTWFTRICDFELEPSQAWSVWLPLTAAG